MIACTYRSGVLSKPSRLGSSPMHSRMVRTAMAILFSQAARSAGEACRREMVDLADGKGLSGAWMEIMAGHTRPTQAVRIGKRRCPISRMGSFSERGGRAGRWTKAVSFVEGWPWEAGRKRRSGRTSCGFLIAIERFQTAIGGDGRGRLVELNFSRGIHFRWCARTAKRDRWRWRVGRRRKG